MKCEKNYFVFHYELRYGQNNFHLELQSPVLFCLADRYGKTPLDQESNGRWSRFGGEDLSEIKRAMDCLNNVYPMMKTTGRHRV